MIDDQGVQLGVMNPLDAMKVAKERGLDLVEVAPQAVPPVCRILDFNKFRYDQEKRDREAKRKHHLARLKETKFKPHIEANDYQVKLQQIKRFLMRGDKVKVTMVYRGRELSHLDLGQRILKRLVADLNPMGKVERDPLLEGRFMSMVFGPDAAAIKRMTKQQQAAASAAPVRVPKATPPPTGGAAAPEASAPSQPAAVRHAKTENA